MLVCESVYEKGFIAFFIKCLLASVYIKRNFNWIILWVFYLWPSNQKSCIYIFV